MSTGKKFNELSAAEKAQIKQELNKCNSFAECFEYLQKRFDCTENFGIATGALIKSSLFNQGIPLINPRLR